MAICQCGSATSTWSHSTRGSAAGIPRGLPAGPPPRPGVVNALGFQVADLLFDPSLLLVQGFQGLAALADQPVRRRARESASWPGCSWCSPCRCSASWLCSCCSARTRVRPSSRGDRSIQSRASIWFRSGSGLCCSAISALLVARQCLLAKPGSSSSTLWRASRPRMLRRASRLRVRCWSCSSSGRAPSRSCRLSCSWRCSSCCLSRRAGMPRMRACSSTSSWWAWSRRCWTCSDSASLLSCCWRSRFCSSLCSR